MLYQQDGQLQLDAWMKVATLVSYLTAQLMTSF